MKTEPIRTRPREARQASRWAQVVIRRVSPWSVLKFSLVFYFLLMLVFLFAMVIVYWILGVIGVIDSISHLLSTAGFGSPKAGFKIHGGWIFTRLFAIGLVGIVVWSLVNALVAVLYNLVSDVIGGVQVTLAERR
jgi:Transmembrane domain of unknown function (DUF3566)